MMPLFLYALGCLRRVYDLEQILAMFVGRAKTRRRQRHQRGRGRGDDAQTDRTGRTCKQRALVDADVDILERTLYVDRRMQRQQAYALAVRVHDEIDTLIGQVDLAGHFDQGDVGVDDERTRVEYATARGEIGCGTINI